MTAFGASLPGDRAELFRLGKAAGKAILNTGWFHSAGPVACGTRTPTKGWRDAPQSPLPLSWNSGLGVRSRQRQASPARLLGSARPAEADAHRAPHVPDSIDFPQSTFCGSLSFPGGVTKDTCPPELKKPEPHPPSLGNWYFYLYKWNFQFPAPGPEALPPTRPSKPRFSAHCTQRARFRPGWGQGVQEWWSVVPSGGSCLLRDTATPASDPYGVTCAVRSAPGQPGAPGPAKLRGTRRLSASSLGLPVCHTSVAGPHPLTSLRDADGRTLLFCTAQVTMPEGQRECTLPRGSPSGRPGGTQLPCHSPQQVQEEGKHNPVPCPEERVLITGWESWAGGASQTAPREPSGANPVRRGQGAGVPGGGTSVCQGWECPHAD